MLGCGRGVNLNSLSFATASSPRLRVRRPDPKFLSSVLGPKANGISFQTQNTWNWLPNLQDPIIRRQDPRFLGPSSGSKANEFGVVVRPKALRSDI